MLTALLLGLGVSGALLLGGSLGAFYKPPPRLIASALAFASGALITAIAFDMFQDAFNIAGIVLAGVGLMAGAVIFVGANQLVSSYGGSATTPISTTVDGAPESLALGATLVGNTTVGILSLVVSIFISNLPESLSGAVDMRQRGRSKNFIVGAWTVVALVFATIVFLSNIVLVGVDETTIAFIQALAGGAVLASLASNIMPQAYQSGGSFVALATPAGFLLAFGLAQLQL